MAHTLQIIMQFLNVWIIWIFVYGIKMSLLICDLWVYMNHFNFMQISVSACVHIDAFLEVGPAISCFFSVTHSSLSSLSCVLSPFLSSSHRPLFVIQFLSHIPDLYKIRMKMAMGHIFRKSQMK